MGPLGKRAVHKAVEEMREKIGALDDADRLVIHGGRYAEAGVYSPLTGRKTPALVWKFRSQANRKRKPKAAQRRREPNMTAPKMCRNALSQGPAPLRSQADYRLLSKWCGWRDLNPHALRRQNLNLVRLPISPHPQWRAV